MPRSIARKRKAAIASVLARIRSRHCLNRCRSSLDREARRQRKPRNHSNTEATEARKHGTQKVHTLRAAEALSETISRPEGSFIGAMTNIHRCDTGSAEYNSGYMAIARTIDELDSRILELLQENARMTQAD